jgi:hypothetical protein
VLRAHQRLPDPLAKYRRTLTPLIVQEGASAAAAEFAWLLVGAVSLMLPTPLSLVVAPGSSVAGLALVVFLLLFGGGCLVPVVVLAGR